MDFRFHLGCAVWAYKGWVGDFYPKGSRSTEFLQLYSDRLRTVEVNSTFYVIPDRLTVERWAKETPANFRFCPKFPKQLTHNGLLHPYSDQALHFLDLMSSFGDRLGVPFVQLPPSYSPANFADLERFLITLPVRDFQIALEVRHADWFKDPHCDRLNELLKSLGVGRVLLDSRPIYDLPFDGNTDAADTLSVQQERRKPNLPLQPVVTAPFSIVRFVSHPDRDLNVRFWQEWRLLLNNWLATGTEVYFFMHCPIEERSPHNLKYFQNMLEKANLPIPTLPWDDLVPPPQQLTLF
ncbi:DUF72 domain-containing protein [Pseudanabaena biceps]|nr:DUF72 domain-containing protein [Pseudanabaena biceps]